VYYYIFGYELEFQCFKLNPTWTTCYYCNIFLFHLYTSILSNLIILRIYDSDIAELIFKHNGISEIRLFYTYDNHVVSWFGHSCKLYL